MDTLNFSVGDIVQMENTGFHGNTKGVILDFIDEGFFIKGVYKPWVKAVICWGDINKVNWFQIRNTPINSIKLN